MFDWTNAALLILHYAWQAFALFLVASFVEESGLFEVLRVDESDLCSSCGGKGVLTTNTSDGAQSNAVCTTCNGCGKFRKVNYR